MRRPHLTTFALVVVVSAVLPACRRRPEWAKPLAAGTAGDGTVAGEPLSVPRRVDPIVVDGALDEAAWKAAGVAGPFVSPGDGNAVEQSPVKGFGRLLWDENKLYVGVVVDDRSPVTPFPADAKDPHIWEQSSAIELMIQPGDHPDNRQYFEVQIDAGSAVFDTSWDDYNRPITTAADGVKTFGHVDWSSNVERAVHKGKGFYAIEAAIPWTAFAGKRDASPPKAGDVWRLNVYTFRDGQRHALAWSPIRGQGNFHRSARFGRIKFQ